MTDDKPDPLAELRAVEDVYVEACTSCMANRPLIAAAIAAWEKERADFLLHRLQRAKLYEAKESELAALRAAVEKVRDELRDKFKSEWVKDEIDALDAALGGGV